MAGRNETDDVLFKALADPNRRKLLDKLHAHEGRTLNDLVRDALTVNGRPDRRGSSSPSGRVLDSGEIVEADPPRCLVARRRHQNKPELETEGDSLCTEAVSGWVTQRSRTSKSGCTKTPRWASAEPSASSGRGPILGEFDQHIVRRHLRDGRGNRLVCESVDAGPKGALRTGRPIG
jgi:DNA-binding transcriptional ArsR family regulator